LPEQPERIPYRTSYWEERWGFCLPHRLREALPEGEYRVVVDTELIDGQMDWGELYLPGESDAELLLSAHLCHPSLANDNLSGIAVAAAFARLVASVPRRLSVRVLFAPATVGAIAWLSENGSRIGHIEAGVVLANLGDAGGLHWKQTRSGDAVVDRAAAQVFAERERGGEGLGTVLPFTPFGYDERQYASPGFALPVGCLSRTPWGQYPEYHTSADDPSFVRPASLADSLAALLELAAILDGNATYRNLSPYGEPQLGRRGLYRSLGGGRDRDRELALLWVLNQSDGSSDLLAIAAKSGLPFAAVRRAAADLVAAELLGEAE
jgi:aminopeptidase-like protein